MVSASVTAPILTFSQSSSVLGTVSLVPFLVMSHVTASKMLSASGSIVNRINSLTETTPFISVRTCAGGAGGAGLGDEHRAVSAATQINAAAATGRRPTAGIDPSRRPFSRDRHRDTRHMHP